MDKSRESYIDTLSNRQNKIVQKIRELDRKIDKAKLFTKHAEIKRLALKEQLDEISREKIEYSRTNQNKYRDSVTIHGLDKVHDQQNHKIQEIKDQLYGTVSMKNGGPQYKEGLLALRDKLTEAGEKKRLNKKIEKKLAKLERLQKRQVYVGKTQRSIIMTKRIVRRKRYKLAKRKAKVNYYQNKEMYVQGLRQNVKYSNTITGKAKGMVLDKVYKHKEKKYKKRKDKHKEKLKKALDSLESKNKICVYGANSMVINSNTRKASDKKSEINRMVADNNEKNNSNTNYKK